MIKRLTLALLLATSCTVARANTADISLQTLSYQDVVLSDLIESDRYTLVMIWSTNCIACEQQKPMIQAFHEEYAGSKASVVGIATDGMSQLDAIAGLIDRDSPGYSNYVASPESFYSEFEILTGKKFRGTPTYIMFDPGGAIAGVAVGPVSRTALDNLVAKPSKPRE